MNDNIIYIRTSSQEQNPLNQLKDCESISSKDYILIEDKQSAFLDFKEREGFNDLVKLIKKSKVKNLIVWDLDRIYRNRKKLKGFFELCKLKKCKVYSFRQVFLNDINKMPYPWNETVFDLMISIFGWIAEEESLRKSDRVKAAVTQKKGVTVSKFGKKWGRKSISTRKRNAVINFYRSHNTWSLRRIAEEFKISVGSVHKILAKSKDRI